jgi:2-phosphoglycolate phosphatase
MMNSNLYQAVLFDLDGTLLDSARDLHACLIKLLQQYQLPAVDLSAVQLELNQGVAALIKLGFGNTISVAEQSQLRNELLNYYHDLMDQQQAHFFPGTISLLNQLTENNITWGIVTNKFERFTTPILKNLNLLDKAKVVICGDQVSKNKPSPQPLFIACRQLNVDPTLCCYVGDSLNDMLAAKAASMPGLLACWGYWPRLHYSIEGWPYTKILYQPQDF